MGMTTGLDIEMVFPPTIVMENLFNVCLDYIDETHDQDKVLRIARGVACELNAYTHPLRLTIMGFQCMWV